MTAKLARAPGARRQVVGHRCGAGRGSALRPRLVVSEGEYRASDVGCSSPTARRLLISESSANGLEWTFQIIELATPDVAVVLKPANDDARGNLEFGCKGSHAGSVEEASVHERGKPCRRDELITRECIGEPFVLRLRVPIDLLEDVSPPPTGDEVPGLVVHAVPELVIGEERSVSWINGRPPRYQRAAPLTGAPGRLGRRTSATPARANNSTSRALAMSKT